MPKESPLNHLQALAPNLRGPVSNEKWKEKRKKETCLNDLLTYVACSHVERYIRGAWRRPGRCPRC